MPDLPPNNPRPPMTDAAGRVPAERTSKLTMRTRTFTASTMAECLQMAKHELGIDAVIVSKRTFRKGAAFGRWGGRQMVEVTFGTYQAPSATAFSLYGIASAPKSPVSSSAPENAPALQKLEARVANLADSVQRLLQQGNGHAVPAPTPFVSAPLEAKSEPPAAPLHGTHESLAVPLNSVEGPPVPAKTVLGRRAPRRSPEAETPAEPYPTLMRQLLDSDVAAPLARQLIAEVPDDLSTGDAASLLRTRISQRLRIANLIPAKAHGEMRLIAFLGTTGVGKTTTMAKLAAQYALMERRRVGVVTLDTNRIAAAQQLQTYGQILRVPVQVASDKPALMQHLTDFRAAGTEIVLIDTAGRSPNDMLPLGETGHLFEDLGPVQKLLAIPATIAGRDMENIVARFQSILSPEALILTKLDEASDHTCFGRLLTMQTKLGLPLAYVTTGQKVPDDIMFPDAHAIAARILTLAPL